MIRLRKIAVGCILASLVVLPNVLWGTSACQVPNPSTVLCAEIPPGSLTNCGFSGSEATCTSSSEINNFPDGGVKASSGSTAQEQENCIRTFSCVWNPSAGGGGSCAGIPNEDPDWSAAAKTVPGTNECPTDEG